MQENIIPVAIETEEEYDRVLKIVEELTFKKITYTRMLEKEKRLIDAHRRSTKIYRNNFLYQYR